MSSRTAGMTLLESMMTMVIGALGIVGVMSLLLSSSSIVRRTNDEEQALMLAQRELELIASRGCNSQLVAPNCDNVLALDNTVRQVWASTTSGLIATAPNPAAGEPVRREYRVVIDADAPGRFEGAETGDPSLTRGLNALGTTPGVVVNVRVTVSWLQRPGLRRAVALQTRVSP